MLSKWFNSDQIPSPQSTRVINHWDCPFLIVFFVSFFFLSKRLLTISVTWSRVLKIWGHLLYRLAFLLLLIRLCSRTAHRSLRSTAINAEHSIGRKSEERWAQCLRMMASGRMSIRFIATFIQTWLDTLISSHQKQARCSNALTIYRSDQTLKQMKKRDSNIRQKVIGFLQHCIFSVSWKSFKEWIVLQPIP